MQVASPPSLTTLQRKISQATHRIQTIRRKNKNSLQNITKNKVLATKLLLQKQALALSLIENQKKNAKLKQDRENAIELLRAKNMQKKQKQRKQIRDILTAVYLVKADEAEELRRISMRNKQRIKQMLGQQRQTNERSRQRARSEQGKGKQAYWRQKLKQCHAQQQEEKHRKQYIMEQKAKQLQNLLQKSRSLQENLQHVQEKQLAQRKRYISALSLPVRKVANFIQHHYPQVVQQSGLFTRKAARTRNDSDYDDNYGSRSSVEPHMQFSLDTKRSEQKLKIVLETLKKKNDPKQ